jgi:hypothetical protein
MNDNTSNNFCKIYVYKFIECLNINYQVFGKENGPKMCYNLKEIIERCNCDVKKDFNMTLNEIEAKILNLPNPPRGN